MTTMVQYRSDLPIAHRARDKADLTDLRIVCLWSALGCALTILFFTLGFGAAITEALALAG
jgi:hypothetical protein